MEKYVHMPARYLSSCCPVVANRDLWLHLVAQIWAFSAIWDVSEFPRGLVDVTRAKGHLGLQLNWAKDIFIYACKSSPFTGLGYGRQNPLDSSAHFGSQAFWPRFSFLTTLPCHLRAPRTQLRCGRAERCAELVSSSRCYSPRHGASMLTRW